MLKLSHAELSQPAVVKIQEFLKERLQRLRIQNDDPECSPLVRGRIAELKTLDKQLFTRKP